MLHFGCLKAMITPRCCASCAAKQATRKTCPPSRWTDVQSGSHKFRALTFWAAPRSKGYYVDLPLEEQAQRLARAAGHLGTCAEYLYNTIVKLEEFGIHDSYLWRLQKLVAEEIKRMQAFRGAQLQ